ncbi:MAG: sensor histidine kinase [Kiritimatiellae bacterium]|nr:sensor histidine kinase [Kiritimatiellia bacterium]
MKPLLTILFCLLLPAAEANAPLLRTAAEIKALSDEEFASGIPFDIEGTVSFVAATASPRLNPNVSVQDRTGAVTLFSVRGLPVPSTGDIIHATGTTSFDSFSQPHADYTNLVRIGHTAVPKPEVLSLGELLRGDYNHRLVETAGMIADAFRDEIDHRYNYLLLKRGSEMLPAAFPDPKMAKSTLQALIGAEVHVAGVCSFTSGARGFLGPRLELTGLDAVRVTRPAPRNPFDAPLLENIHRINPAAVANMGRRAVVGRVIAVWNGDRFILKTADGRFLRATLARRQPPPSYGETVRVVGFPETDLFRINIGEAIWRREQADLPPEDAPVPCTVEALLMDAKGQQQFRPHYFGKTLKITGCVRDFTGATNPRTHLLLDCGKAIIPVNADTCPDAFKDVAEGCVVEASGICLMETENWRSDAPFPHVTGMTLILRTAADLKILSRPPWWTPLRFSIVIGALLVVLGGIFIWNRMLNRLVERRSRALLKEQAAHDVADLKVEERTRLAVELHDTLAQNLTGISLQIDAAQMAAEEEPNSVMPYLESARRKMQNCRDNLRNCLWDLRSRAFEEKELAEAIRKTIAPHIGETNVQIEMDIPCRKLSDNTIHAVLCIIRELAINTVRHGKAAHLTIGGTLDDSGLSFTVADDGVGFDPAQRPGLSEGHFGLQGVTERIVRLGGTFEITSSPGHGTTATLTHLTPDA